MEEGKDGLGKKERVQVEQAGQGWKTISWSRERKKRKSSRRVTKEEEKFEKGNEGRG
jgi:hypothetical protein